MRLPVPVRLLVLLALVVTPLASACGDDAGSAGGGALPAEPVIDDYGYEDEAADLEDGQALYEESFSSAYLEACEWIFADSPDGSLYYAGDEYTQADCELAEPGFPEWDEFDEPESQGLSEGWASACEETFLLVGDDLYWGDDEVVVSQSDCELASPY